MTILRFALGVLLAVGLSPVRGASLDLNLGRLTQSLSQLSVEDRKTVDRSIALIRRGDHVPALSNLSAISKANSQNSAARVLLAYVLLQTGNLIGAFDEAEKAEQAPDHNSYMCLFLAKVALASGNTAVCKRELSHVKGAGDFEREAKELKRRMNANGAGSVNLPRSR